MSMCVSARYLNGDQRLHRLRRLAIFQAPTVHVTRWFRGVTTARNIPESSSTPQLPVPFIFAVKRRGGSSGGSLASDRLERRGQESTIYYQAGNCSLCLSLMPAHCTPQVLHYACPHHARRRLLAVNVAEKSLRLIRDCDENRTVLPWDIGEPRPISMGCLIVLIASPLF